jgi:chromosome segregation ATPase
MLKTWINYRRGRMAAQPLLHMEGMDKGEAFSVGPEDLSDDVSKDVGGDGRVDTERSVKDGEDDYKENLYKGILWMKEKYEQYRDLADERYDRLKEQLTRMEKKYEDLLTQEAGWTSRAASTEIRTEEFPPERGPLEFSGGTEVVVERAEANGDRIRIQELEEQLARTQQRFDEEVGRLRYQLEEKQRMVADLEGQQTTDRVKIEELVGKLRNNSVLLMNIYQELDKSLHFSDGSPRD